jgi:mRNA interferase RelE/StbE
MAQFKVEFSKRVAKDLRGIPKKEVEAILLKIRDLAEEPLPPAAKKLKGDELFRIRIGNYRVIYEIRGQSLVVFVVKVGHRKDVYRG